MLIWSELTFPLSFPPKEAFFDFMDDCQESCIILKNPNFSILPISYKIYNSYPNPFNPITTIRYDLPKDAIVNITIYDMIVRKVKTLVNSPQTAVFAAFGRRYIPATSRQTGYAAITRYNNDAVNDDCSPSRLCGRR